MKVFDDRLNALGEGPLWHPERGCLFWFDILGRKMFSKGPDDKQEWSFDEHFSAAGWVDRDTLLLASETGLWRFAIPDGGLEKLSDLDAENPVTRSNDGRADPWGGFWIGTMGKGMEPGAGAIYRYYRGEVRTLQSSVTVSNAICFSPDRRYAYSTDTVTQKILRWPLDAQDGWPAGPAKVFIDLSGTKLFPDGAVTDAAGNLWCAIWGSACMICFDTTGTETRRIEVPARQASCPAFGGPNLRDLYVTSARDGLREEELASRPLNGATFWQQDVAQGRAEYRVIL